MADALTVPTGEGDEPTPQPAPAPEPQPAPAPKPVNPFKAAAQDLAKASPAPGENPFRESAQRMGASRDALLTASVNTAVDKDPDQHAKAVNIADKLGMPVDFVEPHLDRYEKAMRKGEIDHPQLAKVNPRLAAWMSDVDNAAIAQDDMPALRQMDRAMAAIANPGDPYGILPAGYSFNRNGGIDTPSENGQPGTHYATLEDLSTELSKRQKSAEAYDRQVQTAADAPGSDSPFSVGFQQSAVGASRALSRVAYTLFGQTPDPLEEQDLQRGADFQAAVSQRRNPSILGDFARGAGGIVADIPLMLMGGGPARAANALLTSRAGARLLPWVAKSKYLTAGAEAFASNIPLAAKSGINSGADNGLGYGLVDFAINSAIPAAFGKTGVERAIIGGTERAATASGYKGAAAFILKESGLEATEESITELAQAIHEQATGVDPNALDPSRLLRRIAVAGGLGGVAGAAFNLPEAIQAKMHSDHLAAHTALDHADRLGQVLEQLELSKTQERAPERVRDLLASHEVQSFYQGSEFEAAAVKAGVDPVELASRLGVADAYAHARTSNAGFAVDTANLLQEAANVQKAGGDPAALLLAVQSEPGAPSANEAIAFYQGSAKEVDQLAAELKKTLKNQKPDQTDPIYQDVLAQLVEAGTSENVAKKQAQVTAAVFRIHASRWNDKAAERGAAEIDPVAEYESYKLRIQRATPDALTGKGEVAPTPEQRSAADLIARVRSGVTPKDPESAAHIESMAKELEAAGVNLADLSDAKAAKMLLDAQVRSMEGPIGDAAVQSFEQSGLNEGVQFGTVPGNPAGIERNQKPGALDTHVNRAHFSAEVFRDLFVGEPLAAEGDRLLRAPSLGEMVAKVRAAAAINPKILDAIVGAVPVNVVNDLFGSQAAAKVALHNEPMLQVGSAVNTNLSVSQAVGAASPIGLYLGHVARAATERGAVSLNPRLESEKGSSATGADNGTSFSQPLSPGGAPRARIGITAERHFIITLLEGHDRTSMLHEGAHFYLEVLGDFATRDGAPESIKNDYAAVLKWLGVLSRSEISKAQHEQFAEGFEDYLMEGKAPSDALRGAFANFRRWLTDIYKAVKRIVTLTPEIRDVFDRMLATEDEIAAARATPESKSMFWDSQADSDMSDKEWAAYTEMVKNDNLADLERLSRKLMAPLQRQKKKDWKEAYAVKRRQVADDVANRSVYIAHKALESGIHKLDRETFAKEFGKDALSKLPKGLFAKKGEPGLTPQQTADAFGFASGEEAWTALANMRPMKDVIDAETKEQLARETQDPMLDGTADELAEQAVHNSVHADVLNAQSLRLAVKAGRKGVPLSRIRLMAQQIVSNQKAASVNPRLYLRAERKFSSIAYEKLRQKNYTDSFLAKQQEILNHELYRAASDAKDMADDARKLARDVLKTPTQAMLGKAGGYVWKVTYADGRTENFEYESQAQEADGASVERVGGYREQATAIASEIRTQWKTLTTAQLASSHRILQSLVHQARVATKLNKIAAGEELKDAENLLVTTAETHSDGIKKPTLSRTRWSTVRKFFGSIHAWMKKLSFTAERMDGRKVGGPFWERFVRPLNEAGDLEADRRYTSAQTLNSYFTEWGKGGIGTANINTPHFEPSIGEDISHMGKIMVALNWGTALNRERVLNGFKWTDAQVQELLATLDAADWKLVQAIWDFNESFWPEIVAQEERLKGIPPIKRDRLEVQTAHGTMRGGYFHIVYDPARRPQVDANDASTDARQASGRNPATRSGYTKATVDTTGWGLLLNENAIFQHVGEVIHRLTHEDALADIRKLLNSRAIQDAVIGHFGREAYGVLRDTVTEVAVGEAKAQKGFEQIARYLRSGMSFATMGYNLSTAAIQWTGITQSIVRTGAIPFARAVGRIFTDAASLESSAAWVTGKSKMMANRSRTFHRDIMASVEGLGLNKLSGPIKEYAFYLMQKMQFAVDLPTWIASYETALAENPDDEARAIAIADQQVLDTQSGGQTKDLAKVQRGNEFFKLFTAFYSYFSSTYNLGAESIGKTASAASRAPTKLAAAGAIAADIPRLSVDFLMLVSVPVVLAHALRAALKGDDDHDKSGKHLAKQLAKEHISFLLNTIVLARELSGGVDGFSYSGPGGGQAFKAFTDLMQQSGQGKIDKGWLKAAGTSVGIALHLPSTQLMRIIEGYMYQQEHKTGPLPILFGPPAKVRK